MGRRFVTQPIIAVTDRLDLLRLRDGHPGLAMSVVPLADLARVTATADAVVIIDVDLTDPAKLRPLREHAVLRQAAARLVLVDRGMYAQEVQAKGLGASRILPRPLLPRHLFYLQDGSSADMTVPPDEASEPDAPPRPEPGTERASIQAGADLLVSLFAGRGARTLVDMALINQVGNQVIAAVASVGLDRWLTTVRAHHAGTFQHCLLVTGTAAAFGRFLGLPKPDLRVLVATALLHDIGKAAIPLEILNKPRRLTDEEFRLIKQHPVIGYDMLVGQPEVPRPALLGVRHHHEYLDGSGYPDGLSGAEIGDMTRMLTVVDIYAALIEKRAYKKPRAPAEAMATLRDAADGGRIDRALTAAMGAMVLV